MKDILIKGKRAEQELKYALGCLIAAIAVNIYAIVSYQTQWIEIFTQLHITMALTVFFYVIIICCRFSVFGAKKIFQKKTPE